MGIESYTSKQKKKWKNEKKRNSFLYEDEETGRGIGSLALGSLASLRGRLGIGDDSCDTALNRHPLLFFGGERNASGSLGRAEARNERRAFLVHGIARDLSKYLEHIAQEKEEISGGTEVRSRLQEVYFSLDQQQEKWKAGEQKQALNSYFKLEEAGEELLDYDRKLEEEDTLSSAADAEDMFKRLKAACNAIKNSNDSPANDPLPGSFADLGINIFLEMKNARQSVASQIEPTMKGINRDLRDLNGEIQGKESDTPDAALVTRQGAYYQPYFNEDGTVRERPDGGAQRYEQMRGEYGFISRLQELEAEDSKDEKERKKRYWRAYLEQADRLSEAEFKAFLLAVGGVPADEVFGENWPKLRIFSQTVLTGAYRTVKRRVELFHAAVETPEDVDAREMVRMQYRADLETRQRAIQAPDINYLECAKKLLEVDPDGKASFDTEGCKKALAYAEQEYDPYVSAERFLKMRRTLDEERPDTYQQQAGDIYDWVQTLYDFDPAGAQEGVRAAWLAEGDVRIDRESVWAMLIQAAGRTDKELQVQMTAHTALQQSAFFMLAARRQELRGRRAKEGIAFVEETVQRLSQGETPTFKEYRDTARNALIGKKLEEENKKLPAEKKKEFYVDTEYLRFIWGLVCRPELASGDIELLKRMRRNETRQRQEQFGVYAHAHLNDLVTVQDPNDALWDMAEHCTFERFKVMLSCCLLLDEEKPLDEDMADVIFAAEDALWEECDSEERELCWKLLIYALVRPEAFEIDPEQVNGTQYRMRTTAGEEAAFEFRQTMERGYWEGVEQPADEQCRRAALRILSRQMDTKKINEMSANHNSIDTGKKEIEENWEKMVIKGKKGDKLTDHALTLDHTLLNQAVLEINLFYDEKRVGKKQAGLNTAAENEEKVGKLKAADFTARDSLSELKKANGLNFRLPQFQERLKAVDKKRYRQFQGLRGDQKALFIRLLCRHRNALRFYEYSMGTRRHRAVNERELKEVERLVRRAVLNRQRAALQEDGSADQMLDAAAEQAAQRYGDIGRLQGCVTLLEEPAEEPQVQEEALQNMEAALDQLQNMELSPGRNLRALAIQYFRDKSTSELIKLRNELNQRYAQELTAVQVKNPYIMAWSALLISSKNMKETMRTLAEGQVFTIKEFRKKKLERKLKNGLNTTMFDRVLSLVNQVEMRDTERLLEKRKSENSALNEIFSMEQGQYSVSSFKTQIKNAYEQNNYNLMKIHFCDFLKVVIRDKESDRESKRKGWMILAGLNNLPDELTPVFLRALANRDAVDLQRGRVTRDGKAVNRDVVDMQGKQLLVRSIMSGDLSLTTGFDGFAAEDVIQLAVRNLFTRQISDQELAERLFDANADTKIDFAGREERRAEVLLDYKLLSRALALVGQHGAAARRFSIEQDLLFQSSLLADEANEEQDRRRRAEMEQRKQEALTAIIANTQSFKYSGKGISSVFDDTAAAASIGQNLYNERVQKAFVTKQLTEAGLFEEGVSLHDKEEQIIGALCEMQSRAAMLNESAAGTLEITVCDDITGLIGSVRSFFHAWKPGQETAEKYLKIVDGFFQIVSSATSSVYDIWSGVFQTDKDKMAKTKQTPETPEPSWVATDIVAKSANLISELCNAAVLLRSMADMGGYERTKTCIVGFGNILGSLGGTLTAFTRLLPEEKSNWFSESCTVEWQKAGGIISSATGFLSAAFASMDAVSKVRHEGGITYHDAAAYFGVGSSVMKLGRSASDLTESSYILAGILQNEQAHLTSAAVAFQQAGGIFDVAGSGMDLLKDISLAVEGFMDGSTASTVGRPVVAAFGDAAKFALGTAKVVQAFDNTIKIGGGMAFGNYAAPGAAIIGNVMEIASAGFDLYDLRQREKSVDEADAAFRDRKQAAESLYSTWSDQRLTEELSSLDEKLEAAQQPELPQAEREARKKELNDSLARYHLNERIYTDYIAHKLQEGEAAQTEADPVLVQADRFLSENRQRWEQGDRPADRRKLVLEALVRAKIRVEGTDSALEHLRAASRLAHGIIGKERADAGFHMANEFISGLCTGIGMATGGIGVGIMTILKVISTAVTKGVASAVKRGKDTLTRHLNIDRSLRVDEQYEKLRQNLADSFVSAEQAEELMPRFTSRGKKRELVLQSMGIRREEDYHQLLIHQAAAELYMQAQYATARRATKKSALTLGTISLLQGLNIKNFQSMRISEFIAALNA